MRHEEVKEEVNRIFCDILRDQSIKINEDMTAHDIDRWDSFNHVRIIMAIEEKFNIKFDSFELTSLENVGDLLSVIKKKANAKD